MTRKPSRSVLGVAFALLALALVGALVSLSAPGGSTGKPRITTNSRSLVADTPLATDTATTAPADTPTAQPTATQPPAPTDTPAPTNTPAPTATPAPSWHTVGSYSGSAPQTLPSFTTAYPWRMEWTCTPGVTQTEAFSFNATVDGANLAGVGDICTNQLPTSGAMNACATPAAPGNACYGSHTYILNVDQSIGSYPPCAWTATVEVWY